MDKIHTRAAETKMAKKIRQVGKCAFCGEIHRKYMLKTYRNLFFCKGCHYQVMMVFKGDIGKIPSLSKNINAMNFKPFAEGIFNR